MSGASLQRRLFFGASLWIVLALIVTGVLLSVLFRQHLENELTRRLDADFLQLVSQLEIAGDGTLTHPQAMSDPLYQRVLSGYYWQVDGPDGTLLRSRSLWDQGLEPRTDGGALQRFDGPRGMPLLAAVRRVTLPRMDHPLRLTVAVSLTPVKVAVADFAWTLAVALGLLALGLLAAAALQVGLGLRPLRRLRDELAAIRAARIERLSQTYPGEVAPLVDDLNGVLDHNASLIERARRQAGNLAHALKTPLSVVANEAQRMQRAGETEPARRLTQEVERMQQQIEWHLARTRIAAIRRAGIATPVAPVAERLTRMLQRLHGARGIVIDSDAVDESAMFAGESRDLEQMLGNLLENACKWARGVINMSARTVDGRLYVEVADDGPGMRDDQRAEAARPGRRFDESVPGWGLGLAIVEDLTGAYDGALALEIAELGGLAARLDLPAAVAEGGNRR